MWSCKNHLYSITVPLGLCAAFCSTSSCLHLRQEGNIVIQGAEEYHHENVSNTPNSNRMVQDAFNRLI